MGLIIGVVVAAIIGVVVGGGGMTTQAFVWGGHTLR